MRGAPGPGDNDAQTPLLRAARVTLQIPRRAVRGDDLNLVGDAKFGAGFRRGFHCRPIGVAAHDDPDYGLCGLLLAHKSQVLTAAPATEVVEDRHAIGLGPDPDVSRIREGRVLDFEHGLAIEDDLEVVALEFHAQRVPLEWGDLFLYAVAALAADDFQDAALAGHRLVEHDVVLQRVGAADVVVVLVHDAPDDAARLVFFAGQGLELHLHRAVFEGGIILDADGIRPLARLFQHVRFAGRGVVLLDAPFGRAGACQGADPMGWKCAGFSVIEADCFGQNGQIGRAHV